MTSSSAAPKDASPFAQVDGLGKQAFVLHKKTSLGCSIVGALVLFFMGGSYAMMAFSKDIGFAGNIFMGLLALAAFAGLFFVIRGALRARHHRGVAVYENGLAWIDYKGLQRARWEAVLENFISITIRYVNGIKTGTFYVLDLYFPDKQRLILDNSFVGLPDRMDYILELITAALLPQYTQRLENGEKIPFGVFAIDQKNIYYHNSRLLPWEKVSGVTLEEGILKVYGSNRSPWASEKVKKMPNLFLFLSLCKNYREAVKKAQVAVPPGA